MTMVTCKLVILEGSTSLLGLAPAEALPAPAEALLMLALPAWRVFACPRPPAGLAARPL